MTSNQKPRRYAACKVTRRYCAIMGVWPARSMFVAMGGESSFCMAAPRGEFKEVACLVLENHRGVTSAEGWIRKTID